MPPRPPKPCRKPGCRKLTSEPGGFCAEHLALVEQAQIQRRRAFDQRRRGAASRGYGQRWRELREQKLRQDPLCAHCGRAAQMVHHRDENPRNNSLENLASLCRDCHERLHGRLR